MTNCYNALGNDDDRDGREHNSNNVTGNTDHCNATDDHEGIVFHGLVSNNDEESRDTVWGDKSTLTITRSSCAESNASIIMIFW